MSEPCWTPYEPGETSEHPKYDPEGGERNGFPDRVVTVHFANGAKLHVVINHFILTAPKWGRRNKGLNLYVLKASKRPPGFQDRT